MVKLAHKLQTGLDALGGGDRRRTDLWQHSESDF
jgi:hypothetical protein